MKEKDPSWIKTKVPWEVKKVIWQRWALGDSIVATVNYFELNKDKYEGGPFTRETVSRVRKELLALPDELVQKLLDELPDISSFINEIRRDILERRHFEAVWQVAREWSKQIYYFESEDDFNSRTLFPTKFKPTDARFGSHKSDSLEWRVRRDGSIEVSFDLENDPFFGALREHLLSEELWKDYERLKSLLAESIKQAGERNTVVWVTDEVSHVRQRLLKELETLLAKHKHWFPGKCPSCP